MSHKAEAGYRRNVGLMLVNPAGLVFMAQRIDNPGPAWQMPQGGIDDGEDYRAAGLRELGEEIGTTAAEIIAESADWHRYELPPDLAAKSWGGKYRGQMQKWLLLRYLGTDADINIETKHPEFSTWKWVEPELAPTLIVEFKRALYEAVVAEFLPVIRERFAA